MQNSFAQGSTNAISTSLPTIGALQILVLNSGHMDRLYPGATFTVTIAGNNPHPSSFPLSSPFNLVKLGPGTFSVSADTGVSLSFSGDCNGTINAG